MGICDQHVDKRNLGYPLGWKNEPSQASKSVDNLWVSCEIRGGLSYRITGIQGFRRPNQEMLITTAKSVRV